MKKLSLLFVLLASAMLSCTDAMQEDYESEKFDLSFQGIDESNRVTMDNVVALSTVPTDSTRTSADEVTFDCIKGTDNDTLLYVCNKRGGGWTLYSSDRRTPPIVAQSDHGSFEELMQIDAAKAWVQGMAEDIKVIKTLADNQLNFTSAEIEANKNFWRSVSDPDDFVKNVMGVNPTRGFGDDPRIPTGHYELSGTSTQYEEWDSIGRLTQTDWDQGSIFTNYNYYCPLKSNSNNEHAPAGCVAIAGAQMLYFLHYKFGVPETAPSEASCSGNILNYTMWQGNYTSTIWSTMNTNDIDAAPLVADVGELVGMAYGNDASSANTSNLVYAFANYGISCIYDDYNAGTVSTSLSNGIPVILRAQGAGQSSGHAFITDRYKRARPVIVTGYEWVWDSPPPLGMLLPYNPPIVEYTYLSPVIRWIGMNWGWGSNYYNPNEWYVLTGDWIKDGTNYNTNRHMIYGFQPIQQ
ncbi:MAG: C10 family peptidase [Bacteroidaceae bacterium]|nr:C10 family peptidase [Bacteroidaceae bacterium]